MDYKTKPNKPDNPAIQSKFPEIQDILDKVTKNVKRDINDDLNIELPDKKELQGAPSSAKLTGTDGPGAFEAMNKRSNSVVENKYKITITSERLCQLKKTVDTAVKEHKIFTMRGQYHQMPGALTFKTQTDHHLGN